MRMRILSEPEYRALIDGGKVVEQDANGSMVTFLADGTVLKIFPKKPFLSSDTLRPYATRFVRNAAKLHAQDVWTVTILDQFKVKHMGAMAVHYEPIPGETLRSLGARTDDCPTLVSKFAKFIARLHDQGIYFRAIHLANVIVGEDYKMGLIDMDDLWTKKRPLNFNERLRNLGKTYRYPEDVEFLRSPGESFYIDTYLAATAASDTESWRSPLQAQQDAAHR